MLNMSHVDGGPAIAPWHGPFQGGAKLDQQMVLAGSRAQLHADGQPVRMHSQWQRHGGLAGDVIGDHELLGAPPPG